MVIARITQAGRIVISEMRVGNGGADPTNRRLFLTAKCVRLFIVLYEYLIDYEFHFDKQFNDMFVLLHVFLIFCKRYTLNWILEVYRNQ